MSEIKNLETRIHNAETWKSPYFRINVEDAKKLLAEIKAIQPSTAPQQIVYVQQEPSVIFANMDGGAF